MRKKILSAMLSLTMLCTALSGCGSSAAKEESKAPEQNSSEAKGSEEKAEANAELEGDITFWHSFTQGPRLETIQEAADKFMEEHPKVTIKIETFSWNDFYTKWTTGLASGNVPDMSTALVGQVSEMINSDAIIPLNGLIDDIGRDKFYENALNELSVDGNNYAVPLYSHAMVMWVRKDLLEKNNFEVPKTWDELYEEAKALTKDGVYGLSFPCGSTDFQATNFLNFYVKGAGGSLLTDDLKANLTSDLAIEGINYWLKVYKDCSPKDSIN